jgi:hypothetical protein
LRIAAIVVDLYEVQVCTAPGVPEPQPPVAPLLEPPLLPPSLPTLLPPLLPPSLPTLLPPLLPPLPRPLPVVGLLPELPQEMMLIDVEMTAIAMHFEIEFMT